MSETICPFAKKNVLPACWLATQRRVKREKGPIWKTKRPDDNDDEDDFLFPESPIVSFIPQARPKLNWIEIRDGAEERTERNVEENQNPATERTDEIPDGGDRIKKTKKSTLRAADNGLGSLSAGSAIQFRKRSGAATFLVSVALRCTFLPRQKMSSIISKKSRGGRKGNRSRGQDAIAKMCLQK